jgi:2-keto-4-pentenoate hydratase
MDAILKVLLTPDVFCLLLTIILTLLVKSKIITEKDIAAAKDMLAQGKRISEVTDAVKMTAPAVEVIKAEMQSPDTNRKKAQRAARAVLRGWLKF